MVCWILSGPGHLSGRSGDFRREDPAGILTLIRHRALPGLAAFLGKSGQRKAPGLVQVRGPLTAGSRHSAGGTSRSPPASATGAMAALRNLAIGILKTAGHASVAAACRHHARDATRTLETLGLRPA
ncbi:hypothetical protein GCM10023193_43560 [Planotetraspora kaengkrachanensis]|uniref:Uncharacterized protein n=1 Tax=Planotetraspora kaengkrachanensis TaxID=575193 RepID=A0A8J3PRZ0_9ACTN|nr:hypothetical protein Pka01_34680 [Planotetraspora kaengkrachanensis]